MRASLSSSSVFAALIAVIAALTAVAMDSGERVATSLGSKDLFGADMLSILLIEGLFTL
jgi:hypothetical protein